MSNECLALLEHSATSPMHADIVRKVLLFVLYAIRVAILIALVVRKAFDPSYFTYLTFASVTLVLTVGLVALWVPRLMIFYARWLFPLIFQQTLLVAILIVIIVQLNPDVYASHAIPYGGDLTLGDLHSGDWVVHQYPAIDMLVTLIALHHVLRFSVRSLWYTSPIWGRVLYAFYTLLIVMVPLVIYALVVPWKEKYPTSLSDAVGWIIIVAVAAAIGGLYLLFMLTEHDLHYGWHHTTHQELVKARQTSHATASHVSTRAPTSHVKASHAPHPPVLYRGSLRV